MNTPGGPSGTADTRPDGRPRGSFGIVAAVVVIVGCLVAAAFGLAGGNAKHVDAGRATVPVTSATGTTGTTATSTSGAIPATPAVCGNVKGATVMDDGMVMAPVPNRTPAPADEAAARTLVSSVDSGIAKYSQLSSAIAAGYVPATNPRGYVVHYANWSVVAAGDVLDPSRPSSLVYANTVSGPVLLGAMFLGPAPCQPGPDVAGPLTQWHAHANLCLSTTHEVVGQSNASGQCAVGVHNTNTFFMMHVWTAPSLASDYQFAAHIPPAAYAKIIRSGAA